ncbi:MAG: hypothetical protein JXD22_04910 [Sedimentisphaerales bacterium]|nr:hypothetical protein [Sedimentisphaerales bacterium]
MNPLETTKTVLLAYPQLKDDGDFANVTYLDTAGWGNLRVLFITGGIDIAVGSTDEATPPLIEQCDTTDGSYTAVTDAELAAVIGASDDGLLKAIDVDLNKNHKRYMQVQSPHAGDGTTGANLCIIGILSMPTGNAALDATAQGLDELVKA